MALIEVKTATKHINDLNSLLKGWYSNKESDSLTTQKQRQGELQLSEETMKELVHGVQPERRLRLIMGAVALEAPSPDQETYDTGSQPGSSLEPGIAFELDKAYKRSTRMPDISGIEIPRTTLYVGQLTYLVRIDRVAQILFEGGSLDVVDYQELPE